MGHTPCPWSLTSSNFFSDAGDLTEQGRLLVLLPMEQEENARLRAFEENQNDFGMLADRTVVLPGPSGSTFSVALYSASLDGRIASATLSAFGS